MSSRNVLIVGPRRVRVGVDYRHCNTRSLSRLEVRCLGGCNRGSPPMMNNRVFMDLSWLGNVGEFGVKAGLEPQFAFGRRDSIRSRSDSEMGLSAKPRV